jgi:predicted transposase YdaD
LRTAQVSLILAEEDCAMPKRYDATLKGLLEDASSEWPVLLGHPRASVEVIDADVSTVSGAADKVLRVHGTPDWILHIDFQTGPDTTLPRRTHGYNALLEERHGLLVRSVVVLLRPQADLANLTGAYERQFPGEPPYLTFRYRVLRLWQVPVETLLRGSLGLLPLAPISAVTEQELPSVIERMKQRLRGSPRAVRGKLWSATYNLLGLCYREPFINQLLQGVMHMEESTTYQAILRRGALQARKTTLLRAGRDRFGKVPAEGKVAIEAIEDEERLHQLIVRMMHVDSWQELLELPPKRPRQRKS